MSKFLDAVVVQATGNVKPVDPFFNNLESHINNVDDLPVWNTTVDYIWETTYKIKFTCFPKDYSLAVKNCSRQLREAIYGEFRSTLIELEKSFYDRDVDKIRTKIGELYKLVEG